MTSLRNSKPTQLTTQMMITRAAFQPKSQILAATTGISAAMTSIISTAVVSFEKMCGAAETANRFFVSILRYLLAFAARSSLAALKLEERYRRAGQI